MQQRGSVATSPPSFDSLQANRRLADIAARVVEEFGSDEYYDEFYFERDGDQGLVERESVNPDDEESEFSFPSIDSDFPSPVSAADIFCNGRIRPGFPVLDPNSRDGFGANDVVPAARLPLRKLFIEERETTITMETSSSSSSEADELEGVPEETYCVWRPKEAAAEGRCKKSNSAGSNSKRWNKFRDLLNRSVSDGGKDRFVFLSPSFSGKRRENVKSPAATVASPPPYDLDGGGKRRPYSMGHFSRVKMG